MHRRQGKEEGACRGGSNAVPAIPEGRTGHYHNSRRVILRGLQGYVKRTYAFMIVAIYRAMR